MDEAFNSLRAEVSELRQQLSELQLEVAEMKRPITMSEGETVTVEQLQYLQRLQLAAEQEDDSGSSSESLELFG